MRINENLIIPTMKYYALILANIVGLYIPTWDHAQMYC